MDSQGDCPQNSHEMSEKGSVPMSEESEKGSVPMNFQGDCPQNSREMREMGSVPMNSAPTQAIFARIAGCYDILNRVMTCGIDILWRRRALTALRSSLKGSVPDAFKGTVPLAILDEATGTADFAIGAAKKFPSARITGIDMSAPMLAVGRQKVAKAGLADRVTLLEGNAEALALPDSSCDGVMCAFGYRNFPHKNLALAEAARVLKPEGRLLVLELFRIESRFFAWFTSLWLDLLARFFPRSLRSDYVYLRGSIEKTASAVEFKNLAESAGFTLLADSFYLPSCHCLLFERGHTVEDEAVTSRPPAKVV